MEPVTRYDFIDYFVLSPWPNRALNGNAEGRYVLYADHARCVQDARRVASELQHEIARAITNKWAGKMPVEQIHDMIINDPGWQAAQRVLETWKEGV